ncbi:hypothetical protein J4234_01610 [Candidatus Woesearchaeota archaeon]|nr:hypothetical protein [Candidatus Woesearchaeota archaeon]
MKGLVITSKGVETAAAAEITELIGADCKIYEGCVIFDFNNYKDLCLLCYKSQSADRVLYLMGSFGFDDFFNEFEEFIGKLDFGDWTAKYEKIKIECIRTGNHDFKSVDVEAKAAEFILKKAKGKVVANKDYEIIFFIYIIGNKCYFGVDFAGFELNKRNYKIFTHSNSLRGTIAYALVRESGFGKKELMLDPFSRDGVIAIEAAQFASGFPVNYYKKEKFAFLKFDLGIDYEKFFSSIDRQIKKPKAKISCFDHMFKYVDYSRKNAKIAGVDKFIDFSRTELEWLDIKFKKESVDRIITNLPASKSANLDKIYNEFFYQISYILKRKGAIALISRLPDFAKKHAEKHNFVVAKEKDVWSGEQLLNILVFKNVKNL